MYAAGLTDVGTTRSQNQDAIFVSNEKIGPFPNLFVVADGMGGHKAGDVASCTAVDLFIGYVRDYPAAEFIKQENYLELLTTAATQAGERIYALSESDESMRGMGTTLTACVIENKEAYIVHVGDSRAYAIWPLRIDQLTTDHTYVEQLLKAGKVSQEEALAHPKRHVLTRVLGMPGDVEIDAFVSELADASAVLLCSDGLSNMLDADTLIRIANGLGFVENRVRYLVDEANRRGGHDNISVILIDIDKKR